METQKRRMIKRKNLVYIFDNVHLLGDGLRSTIYCLSFLWYWLVTCPSLFKMADGFHVGLLKKRHPQKRPILVRRVLSITTLYKNDGWIKRYAFDQETFARENLLVSLLIFLLLKPKQAEGDFPSTLIPPPPPPTRARTTSPTPSESMNKQANRTSLPPAPYPNGLPGISATPPPGGQRKTGSGKRRYVNIMDQI